MFKLAFETDNAAFDDNFRGEVSRILSDIANRVMWDTILRGDTIRDINGNTIGHWSLTTIKGEK
jgi:hypothetical protein